MKNSKLIPLILALLVSLNMMSCSEKTNNSPVVSGQSQAELEDEAWHMEELYWEYVQNIDTMAYKALWHGDFIGYPSFGDGVSDKRRIASWIPSLHKDPVLKYSYVLTKKASNAIEDVVIVFYDTDYFWTDKDGQVVRHETYKFTHTWKKVADRWVILGGMAALKSRE